MDIYGRQQNRLIMEKQILSLGKIFQKANVFGPETLSEKFFVG